MQISSYRGMDQKIDTLPPKRPQTSGFQGHKIETRKLSAISHMREIPLSASKFNFSSPYQLLIKTLRYYQVKPELQTRDKSPEFQTYDLEFDQNDNLMIHNFHEQQRLKSKQTTPKSQQNRADFKVRSMMKQKSLFSGINSEPIATQTDEDEQPFASNFKDSPHHTKIKRCQSSAFYRFSKTLENQRLKSDAKSQSRVAPILFQVSRKLDNGFQTQQTIPSSVRMFGPRPKTILFTSVWQEQTSSNFSTLKPMKKQYSVQSLMKISTTKQPRNNNYLSI